MEDAILRVYHEEQAKAEETEISEQTADVQDTEAVAVFSAE